MGHAGRQFQALLWKNWLCRLRHPVLALAEFFWPCLLFTILTVLRFQELPRHTDNCYLEARDLPSRGVLPFVQGLLCNTGSRCRNFSYVESSAHHFRSQTAADRETLGSLPFLREMQDLAEEIYETMDKAEHLQKRWAEGPKTPGSPRGSGSTMELQETEELTATLEILQQRPHLWDFLLSLPALQDDSLSAALHFLRAARGFLMSLEGSAWLPLNHTFSWVSGTLLNMTISTLTTLQRHGAALAGSGSRLSLRSAVWEPQKVQADLQARFGLDELHTEQILNYSAELREMLTATSLERLVCSALSSTSQDGAAGGGDRGDCQLQWSEAKSYLVRAVSWLRVYRQALDRWQQGGVLQEVLAGAGCSLGALGARLEEGSGPWQVVQAVRTGLLLPRGGLVAEGPEDKRSSPKTSRRLQQLQSLLHTLSSWPARKRHDGALGNAVAQDLGFIQEILLCLETPVNDSTQGEPDRLKREEDVVFWGLKQMLSEKAAALCLRGRRSEGGPERPGTSSVCWGLRELLCRGDPSNRSSVEHKLLCSVQDADPILQEVTTGQTDVPVSTAGGYLGWQRLPTQLPEVNLSCAQLSQLLGASASPGGCKQLISAVVCHMSENSQLSLDQTLRWKACPGLLRDACKVARSVSTRESFLSRLSDLPALTSMDEMLSYVVFSEDSPCYEENMDWGFIRDNDIASLDNVPESPVAAISSAGEMCQVFWQPMEPSEALEMLQRVSLVALRALLILAENPSLTRDVLCAALSCKHGGTRRLLLSAVQGFTLGQDHYQEIEKIWNSPTQLTCESLIRNLSRALGSFESNLENATAQDCVCQPELGPVQHVHRLAKSLAETWLSGFPIATFLSNFTVPKGVRIRDLMNNITELTEELRSSVHISDEAIDSILEASVSHSKVLWSALTAALSGRCDREILRLLLTLPEDETSRLVTEELCGLPGSRVYPLLVSMGRNLNLRSFVYKTLIPPEARGLLLSLSDVVSSLSSLLGRAQHVLRHLPAFLHTLKIDAWLDTSGFLQVPRSGLARGSVFGSFQTVVKMVCKHQASFLSDSNTFINLPRVNELLEDNKEKFNIPAGSTPFCLKLYQEILQSPNGAMVWSFLKPVLHGKILYTPNSPEIHQVIQKANYTFHFVDKLKALLETVLKMSSLFQGSGNGQVFNQLQKALRNKFIRRFIEVQLHIDVDTLMEKLQTYGGMLEKMFNHTGTDHIRLLGRVLVNLSSCVTLDRFQAMDSVDALESQAHELMKHNNFLASVIFNSSLVRRNVPSASLKLPPHVTYTIRTSVLYSMRTDMVKNPSWKFHPQSLPADGFKYNYLFVPLQDMIERAIIAVQTGHDAPEPAAQTQAAPYPCHTSDLFLNNVGFFFPLIMMLTWMVSVASMVRKLVYEREIQIEEYLRMMGVHPTTYFLAWFLENMAVLAVSSAALATVLKASGIFTHSNACVVFLYLLDFGVSIVMLSYFLSTLFDRANTAALCTSLVYMISFLPYIVLLVLRNQLSPVVQMFLCLLSTTAFGQGVFFITFLEGQEAGIQWSNMYQAPERGGMTFGWVCWMILFDSSLYFLCGWYFSNLIPGSFGVRRPWYFPVTGSYWRSLCGFREKQPSSLGSSPFVGENHGHRGSLPRNGEGELRGGHLGVALVSVTKDYEGHKAAVQDLSLTFHRGQIAALLGTNGAGKTTVISLLTGLHPPTSGTIIVDGKNLQTDLPRVRRELGVCPQHDVLFDSLTVQEHLLLFGSIKAPWWTQEELRQQVAKTLQDVELTQHQHKPTRALSGGTKRKLSLGIAFMGTSRTVILDEPTSGVDPCSRRGLWDILLRYREGRTIVFTTHHLDEAEVLSDCVAVLQHGRLRCCGPPVCLKEAHGQGLRLTLTQQPPALGACGPEDIARVTSLIQVYIPQASLKGSSGGELTYTIPKDANTACFKGLFQALDQNQQQLHLAGYGLSDTTLEEVFLTLLQDSNEKSHLAPGNQSEPQRHSPASRGSPVRPPPVQGRQLLAAQGAALLQKRLRRALRAWRGSFADLLLPVLFVALAMGLFMVRPLATSYPPLRLTPGHYERAETYFFSSGDDDMDLTHVLLQKFRGQGLICTGLNPDLRNSSCWRRDSHMEFQDSCGCLRCPNSSAGAPYLTNGLGHTLLNLSGADVEEYLLLPSEKPRLGGWSFGVHLPGRAEAANTSTSKSETLAKVWYNQKSFHSLPSYLNHLNNLVLWRHLPPAADWRQYGITLYSHPYGGALLNEDKILESIRQCGVALCIVLGFSILSASIGSSVVRDRVTGAKRLQHISGLGYRTYWFTNFLYDMLFYLISVGLCVAIIVAFQLTAFTFRENLAATALLLALFGYATLPWMYLMSGIFSSADVALVSYISLNFIFGLCTMLMTIVPRLLAIVSKAQKLQNIYDVLKWAFTIFPQFCLGQGLIELCYNQIKYDLTHSFGVDSYVSPFEMSFLGWIFVELALQGTVVLLLRILLHWDLLRPSRGPSALHSTGRSSKDVDVWKEQLRVSEGRTEGDLLVLHNLSKRYSNFCKKTSAVQDVSVAIPRGECFGLLGANGAGKTTVFGMLTGDVRPSSGRAVVRTQAGDHVALSSAGEAGILIGYCPQQDALDGLLTGREHLRYYCSLRGIPKQRIPEVVGDLLRRLHLEAHADKLVATYSGGTKRKLSTALALVGKPDILLLDEPSSGMDPCSKRYLWQTILAEVREGCAAVLTSHSMEECEVLCTRLAVMVRGSFRCLGSPEHVKDRFGDAYAVKVWLCKEAREPSAVSNCLNLHFPGTQLKGQRLNLLEYQVPKRWGCLADLFKVLENNKTTLNIEHYSVSQTTLEQVLIRFATEQQPTPHPRDGRALHHLPV